MSIIEQPRRKSVGPSKANVLSSRLVATWTATCSAQIPQRPRPEATDIIEAVPAEDLVLLAEMMVEPNVERILIVHSTWTGEIVVEQARTVGHRIQIDNVRSRWIDHCGRDHVRLAVVADRIAELNGHGLPGRQIRVNTRIVMSTKGVKNGARVE